MGRRITDLEDPAFDALFTSFKHTAYRLETLQVYDVGYEIEPYNAFLAGRSRPRDESKNAWTAMLRDAEASGKVVQRVHLVNEPLTDYLRYEFEWSYPPNVEAGEDIRILPTSLVPYGEIPLGEALRRGGVVSDHWLFDSSDLWVMEYDEHGRFLWIEQKVDDHLRVRHARWRDAALHYAIPYRDYMRHRELLAATS